MAEGNKSLLDFLGEAAQTAGTVYATATRKSPAAPPAATANQNKRKQDWTVPIVIGGAAIVALLGVFMLISRR